MTDADVSVAPVLLIPRAAAILLAAGRELGTPERVIARGLVPSGPGLLTLVVATGEGSDPFLEAVCIPPP